MLASDGWKIFKAMLTEDSEGYKCLESQINSKLLASSRNGEAIASAKYAGQLDLIPVILGLPNKRA